MSANAERIAALKKTIADATHELGELEKTVPRPRPEISPDGTGRRIKWLSRADAAHPVLYRQARAAAELAGEDLRIEPDPAYG